jgi:hypothetical protein
MDLQTSTAAPLAGCAFLVSGTDLLSGSPSAIGSRVQYRFADTISGKGSIADQNLGGTITSRKALSGTSGCLESDCALFTSTTTFQFTGYRVDATHIKLIESDNTPGFLAPAVLPGTLLGRVVPPERLPTLPRSPEPTGSASWGKT